MTRAENSGRAGIGEFSAASLIHAVKLAYEDLNKLKKARQRLATMRQSSSIDEFLREFDFALFDAQADAWPLDAKITLLVSALNKTMKKRLDSKDWPEDYKPFCTLDQHQWKSISTPYKRNQHRALALDAENRAISPEIAKKRKWLLCVL